MGAMSATSGHYDAFADVADVNGLVAIYDSADLYNTERQVIFGDQAAVADWDHARVAGFQVVVNFDKLTGVVADAHGTQNGVPVGDVTGTRGTAGQRLMWTLNMLSAPSADGDG
jgi:hypothetical protein